jgi:hypothetical protein
MGRAMQLQHVGRAGLVVQAVDVLSDQALPPACRENATEQAPWTGRLTRPGLAGFATRVIKTER